MIDSSTPKFMAVFTKELVFFEYTFNANIKPLFPPLCNKPIQKTSFDAVYALEENTLIFIPGHQVTVHSLTPTEIMIRPFMAKKDIMLDFLKAITRFTEDIFSLKIEVLSIEQAYRITYQ